MDYADAGVNIRLGDDASKILYNAAKLTWDNRRGRLGEVVEVFEDFSGLRGINVGSLPAGTYMGLGFDGVGTKMELGERIGKHDTVAYDLFAMVCDDAVVRGMEPVVAGSILDVRSLGEEGAEYTDFVRQLGNGYVGAAKEAGIAVINGEVAELGARVHGYGKFNYNWGAGLVSFGRKDRMLTGNEINPGDELVGLREDGFRSNGLSLVRKVLQEEHGDEWHEERLDGKSLAELALHPSRIYSKAAASMFGGLDDEPRADVHGVAHITGGGMPGKVGRMLRPSGYGAVITHPLEPSSLMLRCQEWGDVSDRVAYETWNMGQGMVIATPDADQVISVASSFGVTSECIGHVTSSPGITIQNRGLNGKRADFIGFE